MSNYLPKIKFEMTFEGDRVTAMLRQIERVDVLSADGIAGAVEQSKFYESLFIKYAEDFAGLRDANGNAITAEVVARDSYFFPIIFAVVKKLFEESKPKDPSVPGSPVAPRLPGNASAQQIYSAVSAQQPGETSTGGAPA